MAETPRAESGVEWRNGKAKRTTTSVCTYMCVYVSSSSSSQKFVSGSRHNKVNFCIFEYSTRVPDNPSIYTAEQSRAQHGIDREYTQWKHICVARNAHMCVGTHNRAMSTVLSWCRRAVSAPHIKLFQQTDQTNLVLSLSFPSLAPSRTHSLSVACLYVFIIFSPVCSLAIPYPLAGLAFACIAAFVCLVCRIFWKPPFYWPAWNTRILRLSKTLRHWLF